MLFKHRLPLALCLSLTLWAAGCQPQPTTEPTMTPDVPSSPGAGKNDKSAQQHLYRLNPTPRQGYEIVLTIQDAPGPFKKMGWSALYQAKGCNYVVNDFAGVRGEPEHTVVLPFTERPDGSYAATVYLDAMLDEDYYGNGVCQWQMVGVGAGVMATGTPAESSFRASLQPDQVVAEQPVQLFYWKGYYPRSKTDGFRTWGNNTREKFALEARDNLFSMTLTPKKVQP
ncbi:MAG: hypothetical protein Q7U48_16980 [Hydrogenophaga sp.]|nr:hypothetical protein [Hydrogenophaga sp.]